MSDRTHLFASKQSSVQSALSVDCQASSPSYYSWKSLSSYWDCEVWLPCAIQFHSNQWGNCQTKHSLGRSSDSDRLGWMRALQTSRYHWIGFALFGPMAVPGCCWGWQETSDAVLCKTLFAACQMVAFWKSFEMFSRDASRCLSRIHHPHYWDYWLPARQNSLWWRWCQLERYSLFPMSLQIPCLLEFFSCWDPCSSIDLKCLFVRIQVCSSRSSCRLTVQSCWRWACRFCWCSVAVSRWDGRDSAAGPAYPDQQACCYLSYRWGRSEHEGC